MSRDVFNAIRTIINGIIRNNDVLSDASIENVQALVGMRVYSLIKANLFTADSRYGRGSSCTTSVDSGQRFRDKTGCGHSNGRYQSYEKHQASSDT